MQVLLLSQWFDPEPAFKGLVFAKSLRNRGNDVEVLTGFPNYPGGNVYPGYHIRILRREVIDGIVVNRVPLYPSHNSRGFLRILNYLSFCVSAMILGPLAVKKPDVIYVYNLPTVALVALALRGIYRAKVVLDVQDLWPESVAGSNMMPSRGALKVLGLATNRIYRSVDRLTVLSAGFKSELMRRGIPEQKIEVIYNWSMEDEPHSETSESVKEVVEAFRGTFNIVFAGTMGKMQGLDSVIEAAALLEAKQRNISFWFIGGGIAVDDLKRLAQTRQLSNVQFHPRMTSGEIKAVLARADVLLVHLRKDPLFTITIPSKIQAYMRAGRPILAAVEGDAARLVELSGAGISCEPGNPKRISEAVLNLSRMDKAVLSQMGRKGREYYEKNLSLSVGTSKFIAQFEGVMRPGEYQKTV